MVLFPGFSGRRRLVQTSMRNENKTINHLIYSFQFIFLAFICDLPNKASALFLCANKDWQMCFLGCFSILSMPLFIFVLIIIYSTSAPKGVTDICNLWVNLNIWKFLKKWNKFGNIYLAQVNVIWYKFILFQRKLGYFIEYLSLFE